MKRFVTEYANYKKKIVQAEPKEVDKILKYREKGLITTEETIKMLSKL